MKRIVTVVAVVLVSLALLAGGRPAISAAATTHTIAVFGDPQEADPTSPDLSAGFQFIVPFLSQTGADAAIGLGDYARVEGFTQAQTDERYTTFLNEYDKTGIPRSNTVWVQGNHDCVSTMDRTEWATYFGQPADLHAWALYQIDGIDVIQLEGWAQGYDGYISYYGEGDSRNSPQANWLVATLQSLPSDAWVVVADHVPVADTTENPSVEAESPLLEALFAKYGVDLVLGGHDHDYRRHMDPTGVPYITDGMAGGPPEATNFVPIDAYDAVEFSGDNYDPNAFGYMTIQFDGTAMHVAAYAAQLGATSMQSFDTFEVSNREWSVPTPTLIGFAPTLGPVGSSVTLTGSGFTGASAVSFNGTAATSFSVDSDTQIRATVPSGASSGPISVTTPGGTASSATSFTVIPTITFTSPAGGENWLAGTPQTVSWTLSSALSFGQFRIYFADAANKWFTLKTFTATAGQTVYPEPVTLPAIVTPGSTCRIWVYWRSDPTVNTWQLSAKSNAFWVTS